MLQPISRSWPEFHQIIFDQLALNQVSKVLEIGAGAKPYLKAEDVTTYKLQYTVIDVEFNHQKLDYARSLIHNFEDMPLEGETYDLILSHMVLEHLKKPSSFHQNIQKMMHKHTIVCHLFATKYGLPSLANLILPSVISDFIIYSIQNRDPALDGKYPAYYRRCLGPTKHSIKWWKDLGYQIIEYNGYLGHGYFSRIPIIRQVELGWNWIVRQLKSPLLCSNAILVLRKTP